MKNGGGFIPEVRIPELQKELESLFPPTEVLSIEFIGDSTNFNLIDNNLKHIPDNEKLKFFLENGKIYSVKENVPNPIEELETFYGKMKENDEVFLNGNVRGYVDDPELEFIISEIARTRGVLHVYINDEKKITPPDYTSDLQQHKENNKTFFDNLVNLLTEIKKINEKITNLQLIYVLSFFYNNEIDIWVFFSQLQTRSMMFGDDLCNVYIKYSKHVPYNNNNKFLPTDDVFRQIITYQNELNTSLGIQSIMEYILEQELIKIKVTANSLTLEKSFVSYLSFNETDFTENTIILGIILTIVNVDIISGNLTFTNQFRWCVDRKMLRSINDSLKKKNKQIVKTCRVTFELLNVITPLINLGELEIENEIEKLINLLITKTQELCVKYCEKRREGVRYKSRESCLKNNCVDLYFFLLALRTFIIDRKKRITGAKYVDDDSFAIVLDNVIETLARVKIDKEKKENSFDIQRLTHHDKEVLLENLNKTERVISGFDSNQYALVVKYFANKQGVRKYNFLGFKFGKYGGTRKFSKRKRSRKALKYCNKYLTRR